MLAKVADVNARSKNPTIGRHHDFADGELGTGAAARVRQDQSIKRTNPAFFTMLREQARLSGVLA